MAITTLEARSLQIAQENRREPRVSYCLKMCIAGIEVLTSNISISGAQLCCPAMRYEGLPDAHTDENVSVAWDIPTTGEQCTAVAAIRYANTCGDEILIGIEFVEFATGGRDAWHRFVDELISLRRP